MQAGSVGLDDACRRLPQDSPETRLAPAQCLFGLLALGDIGVNAHPLANFSRFAEHRHRADLTHPPLAIVAADAVLELKHPLLCHGPIPRVDGRLRIFGVHGFCPAIALVVLP